MLTMLVIMTFVAGFFLGILTVFAFLIKYSVDTKKPDNLGYDDLRTTVEHEEFAWPDQKS